MTDRNDMTGFEDDSEGLLGKVAGFAVALALVIVVVLAFLGVDGNVEGKNLGDVKPVPAGIRALVVPLPDGRTVTCVEAIDSGLSCEWRNAN